MYEIWQRNVCDAMCLMYAVICSHCGFFARWCVWHDFPHAYHAPWYRQAPFLICDGGVIWAKGWLLWCLPAWNIFSQLPANENHCRNDSTTHCTLSQTLSQLCSNFSTLPMQNIITWCPLIAIDGLCDTSCITIALALPSRTMIDLVFACIIICALKFNWWWHVQYVCHVLWLLWCWHA